MDDLLGEVRHLGRYLAVPLLVAVLVTPLPVNAQADTLSSAVATLKPTQRVQLEVRGNEELLVGQLVTGDVPWVLRTDNDQRAVPPEEIQQLWAEMGDHAGEGLLYGILAGTAAGAVVGAVTVEASNSRGFSRGGGSFVGAAVGFFSGLITGVAIGANTPKWELRYSSESDGIAVSVSLP